MLFRSFISPFHYANMSRALVPGVGYSITSMIGLFVLSVVLLLLAGMSFQRRDYDGAILTRRAATTPTRQRVRVRRWWLDSLWRGQLMRHRIALIAWAATTAAFSILWMGLEPTVTASWAMSDFFTMFLGGSSGTPISDMYVSFGCDTAAAIVVAYAVSNASGWVMDLHEGRVAALLSVPLSWRRLMSERLFAAVVGVAVVTASWLLTGAFMGLVVDSHLQLAGSLRAFTLCLLIGWAGASLAAILAVVTRNAWATTGLIVYEIGRAHV